MKSRIRNVIVSVLAFLAVSPGIAKLANPQNSPEIDVTSQMAEGLNLSGGVVAAIVEFYLDNGRFPDSHQEAGVVNARSISGQFVNTVSIEPATGIVLIEFGNYAAPLISGRILKLVPEIKEPRPVWKCVSEYIPKEVWPKKCGF